MRRLSLAAIAAAILVLVCAASLVEAQAAACAAAGNSVTECYGKTVQGAMCVFNYQKNTCEVDPCNSATASASMDSCLASGCLPLPYVQGTSQQNSCISPNLLCNALTEINCHTSGFCQARDGYCAFAQEPVVGKTDAECDINFPQWSIALIVIWVCIMLILGFIIFLIVNKNKSATISRVERSDVQVDSLNINDAFQLEQPLSPGDRRV